MSWECSPAVSPNLSRGRTPIAFFTWPAKRRGRSNAPRDRLTRQLNIANRETQSGRPGNARGTLALARQTLEHAAKKDFNDQERLSGWISLCELARDADNKPFANAALDQALAALNQLTPEPSRCEYVPGIEHEVRALRGDGAAAAMLRTAADWAMDLQQPTRRSAWFVFAGELFRCNDYEGARLVLRHDRDAAWRSDALIALSEQARWETGNSGELAAPAAMAPATLGRGSDTSPTTAPSIPFGKSLDFKSNYYRP